MSRLNFRLRGFTLLAAGLLALIFFISPAQFPVVLYKTSQVALAAILGYWLDRHIFPENRPSDLVLADAREYAAAAYRRAGVVVGTMIAFALAL